MQDYDNVLGTPNVSRKFNAYNGLASTSYYTDSIYFSDLVNKRKDLTPLYIVSSEIHFTAEPPISLTVHDIRKFINDTDADTALRYDSGTLQGNFESVASIFNWLKYNSDYNGTVSIKGDSSTISDKVYLNVYKTGDIIIGE